MYWKIKMVFDIRAATNVTFCKRGKREKVAQTPTKIIYNSTFWWKFPATGNTVSGTRCTRVLEIGSSLWNFRQIFVCAKTALDQLLFRRNRRWSDISHLYTNCACTFCPQQLSTCYCYLLFQQTYFDTRESAFLSRLISIYPFFKRWTKKIK